MLLASNGKMFAVALSEGFFAKVTFYFNYFSTFFIATFLLSLKY